MAARPDRGPSGPPVPLRTISGPRGARSRDDDDEYLEQDEDEVENAGRRKSLIALAVLAVLVVAGLILFDRLRSVAALQDCLMSRATNCAPIANPPAAPGNR